MGCYYSKYMAQDDSSSTTGGSNVAFDFNSQAGVLGVLSAIRGSELSVADKNELRDLVFQYSNGGGDVAVRNILEDRLRTFSITPVLIKMSGVKSSQTTSVVEAAVVKPVVRSGFYSGRPTPVFSQGSITTTEVSIEKESVAEMVRKPDVVTVATPVSIADMKTEVAKPYVPVPQFRAPVTDPTSNDVVVNKIPVYSTAPSKQPEAEVPVNQPIIRPNVAVPTTRTVNTFLPPVFNHDLEKKSVENNLQDVRNTAPAVTAPTINATVDSSVSEARMERIRSIKSDINNRVGNPVNLVDLNNEVGREYMSALLSAMKLLSSDSDSVAELAMNRLEAVYNTAINLLDTTATAPSVAVPVVTVVPQVVKILPTIPVSSEATSSVNNNIVTPEPFNSPFSKVSEVENVNAGVSGYAVQEPVTFEEKAEPTMMQNFETSNFSTPIQSPVVPTSVPPLNVPNTPIPASPLKVAPVSEIPSYQSTVISPLTESATPLRQISELRTRDEVNNTSVNGNPLYTKAIDDGLEQLLSEWSLFKKSGLFGTGPSGREHPLFLKLAAIQIPLILAGRFDGSTQEIKQSVTDYMNGWRYEQGIVYEKGESFEVYLRRVIKHIIDLQNQKRQS